MSETEAFLPHNEICVLDPKYVLKNDSIYYFKKKKSLSSKMMLEDADHKEIYKCTYNNYSAQGFLKDPNEDVSLFKFKNILHFMKPNELIISSIKNDKETKELTCNVKIKSSLKEFKYQIEFFNKASKKNEILDVYCSSDYKECGIYYGKRRENGILICRFDSSKFFTGIDFKIEIGPNIDTMFIIIIVNYIFRHIEGRRMAAAINTS
ncbi:hypothetical protein BCR32DRAFT_326007 [Anaeromyces robustus]|uniref:Tubby C-terminal domain-containing protein n=1 Tax=Anaeromyces robustus TaxID=1754192 RepID=A0A1Y1XFT5_9FUNG|nr:hypothetical protein BCR32DRAFT_326007 [Anaeromyces robustus]|eukprot:ORX84276.1 hypothetical protein BCR32DRAFT_326007 [Anaeromyces robustus]